MPIDKNVLKRFEAATAARKVAKSGEPAQPPPRVQPRQAGYSHQPGDAGESNSPKLREVLKRAPVNDLEREFHELNDDALVAKALLEKRGEDYHETDHNQRLQTIVKALDTTGAGTGAEWDPTEPSTTFFDRLRNEQSVAGMLPTISPPRSPYVVPLAGADVTAFYETERATDATHTEAQFYGSLNPPSDNITFTARKMAARVVLSEELEAFSIIPSLPLIRRKLDMAIARAVETGIINGDRSATHLDNDTDGGAANLAEKGIDGFRDAALATASPAQVNAGGGALTLQHVRDTRREMGIYGTRPNELFMLVSNQGYIHALDIPETITRDKFGPQATIGSGVLERLDGMDIVVSDLMREDIDSTGVNSAGGPNTLTSVLLVNKEAWLLANFRQLRIRAVANEVTGQTIVVGDIWLDLQSTQDKANNAIVGMIHNVQVN